MSITINQQFQMLDAEHEFVGFNPKLEQFVAGLRIVIVKFTLLVMLLALVLMGILLNPATIPFILLAGAGVNAYYKMVKNAEEK